jgi:hypothetical protein
VAVTGIKLNKATLTLTVNSTESLVETVEPANATDKVVSWFSDKPGVAEVSSAGVVAAKAAGKATITATTRDGSHTASCEVTVSQPSKAVTGVALDMATLDLVVGGSTGRLTATVSPTDADNPAVTWSSSDEQVATVDAGAVTAARSGTATISVRTAEGQYTANCAVTVHSDAVTSLTAKAQLTGQIALYWTDPVDENATQIEVIMQSADGPVSRLVELGKKQTAFSGLTNDTSYTFLLSVRGASNTTSEQVMTTGTPIKVEKVLKGMREWESVLQPFHITDTFGSSELGHDTHDTVIARRAEISTVALFPKNYRWVLMPGLADPTNPSLVSLKSEEYVTTTENEGTTSKWVETERYLHIRNEGFPSEKQFFYWAWWGPPSAAYNVAYADLADSGDPDFNVRSTFALVPRDDVPGAVSFQWLGDGTGDSRIVDHSFHVVAMDAGIIGNRFASDTAWFIEDVTTVTP